MQACIIYQPTKSSMQSGYTRNNWIIKFIAKESKNIEPLMGWTSSTDMLQELELKFPDMNSAIDFAKNNYLDYQIIHPQQKKVIKRTYAQNFL